MNTGAVRKDLNSVDEPVNDAAAGFALVRFGGGIAGKFAKGRDKSCIVVKRCRNFGDTIVLPAASVRKQHLAIRFHLFKLLHLRKDGRRRHALGELR